MIIIILIIIEGFCKFSAALLYCSIYTALQRLTNNIFFCSATFINDFDMVRYPFDEQVLVIQMTLDEKQMITVRYWMRIR
jgi:hypothetical protein